MTQPPPISYESTHSIYTISHNHLHQWYTPHTYQHTTRYCQAHYWWNNPSSLHFNSYANYFLSISSFIILYPIHINTKTEWPHNHHCTPTNSYSNLLKIQSIPSLSIPHTYQHRIITAASISHDTAITSTNFYSSNSIHYISIDSTSTTTALAVHQLPPLYLYNYILLPLYCSIAASTSISFSTPLIPLNIYIYLYFSTSVKSKGITHLSLLLPPLSLDTSLQPTSLPLHLALRILHPSHPLLLHLPLPIHRPLATSLHLPLSASRSLDHETQNTGDPLPSISISTIHIQYKPYPST